MSDLTPRQSAFVEHYVRTGNATQSYLDAGYTAKNRDIAAVCASQLLRNPKIARRINDVKADVASNAGVTPEQVLAQWAKIAFADFNEFVEITPDRALRLKARIDGTVISRISVNETSTGRSTSIQIDRANALEKLGKYFGLISDNVKVQHSGTVTEEKHTHVLVAEQLIQNHPELIDTIFNFGPGLEKGSGSSPSNRIQEVREPEV